MSKQRDGWAATGPRNPMRPPRGGGGGPGDPLFNASLDKAMTVLELVSANPDPMSLTEIAAASGFGRSAVQRLTHTLATIGYLRKDEATRRFSLAPRVLDLTYGYLSKNPVVSAAMPFLIDACDRCRESINMSELDGPDIVYVARIPVRRLNLYTTLVGRRMPAFCTAGGRVMMAHLPRDEVEAILAARPLQALTAQTITDRTRILEIIDQARQDGYSVTQGEALIGQIAVSAPVLDARGRPLAAIHGSVSTASWTEDRARAELAPLIIETARMISRQHVP